MEGRSWIEYQSDIKRKQMEWNLFIFNTILVCIVGRELWEMAYPYLTSPIEKTLSTNDLPENALLSGNIISEDNSKNKYAISKERCKKINVIENGKYIIEIWKYNPLLLSMDKKKVDLLSLYLSMNGSEYGDMINQVENLFKEK